MTFEYKVTLREVDVLQDKPVPYVGPIKFIFNEVA